MCSVWELCITLTRWLPFPLTHSNISKFILFSRIASLALLRVLLHSFLSHVATFPTGRQRFIPTWLIQSFTQFKLFAESMDPLKLISQRHDRELNVNGRIIGEI